jgi:hypothetical protein
MDARGDPAAGCSFMAGALVSLAAAQLAPTAHQHKEAQHKLPTWKK